MAIICPKCGREFLGQRDKCPVCGCATVDDSGIDNSEAARKERLQRLQAQKLSEQRTVQTRPQVQSKQAQITKEVSDNQNSPKMSTLGILALVFSFMCCISPIGLILAIVDLCRKDGTKKTCSAIALCVCGAWIFLISFSSMMNSDSSKKSKDSSRINNTYNNQQNSNQTDDDGVGQNPAPPTKSEEKNIYNTEFDYDDMHVKYLSHEITENMSGDMCIAIYYEFTNNSNENKMFDTEFSDKAFQDGVELDFSIFHVNDASKNSSREIQPGVTVTVASGFVLNNDGNVTLQVEPWISFSGERLMEIELSVK